MADKFDRYREALVVETETVWPKECDDTDSSTRSKIEQKLHADAAACSQLEYVRLPTGFCRKITVTTEDIERAQ